MKLIEILGRFRSDSNNLSDEDKAALQARKIIDPDYEETKSITYEYDKLMLDLEQIADIFRYDEVHTQIVKKSNVNYVLKIPYEEFLNLYQELLGVSVYSFIEEL